MYTYFVKPSFDKIFALITLVVASPVLLATIILLTIVNKGKVWFVQPRPGYQEKIFQVIKFKTMTDERDSDGNLLDDSKRLSRVGKWIRRSSIDELPQLINVLKGDMSFVGPRPLLVEYLHLYSDRQKRRHSVKPGITGWAQVNGRNAISWKDKFDYDIFYVDNMSFRLDCRILFLTIIKIFKSEGITSKTSATMEKFTGN